MAFISRASFNLLKLREVCARVPSTYTQFRWKKPKGPRRPRKPKWLPTAPSKLFRIPQHPVVPPEEMQLRDDLMEEYYRKIESMRNLFREELAQKNIDDGTALEKQKEEEAQFLLLLEENKKENERVRAIREEALEKLFQEQQLKILELEEDRKIKEQNTKMRVEEIVRREKEKWSICITHETLEEAIERALDNPVNISFCIDLSGNVKFEGKPPSDFEEEVKRKIAQSMEN